MYKILHIVLAAIFVIISYNAISAISEVPSYKHQKKNS